MENSDILIGVETAQELLNGQPWISFASCWTVLSHLKCADGSLVVRLSWYVEVLHFPPPLFCHGNANKSFSFAGLFWLPLVPKRLPWYMYSCDVRDLALVSHVRSSV